jgi:hypothetical protein
MWLKSRLFPFDQDINAGDLADMLDELVRADEDDPCIWRYEMDGKPYIQLPKWSDYQKPSHPQPSKLPICPPDQVPKGHRLPEDFHEAVSDTKKSKKKGSS